MLRSSPSCSSEVTEVSLVLDVRSHFEAVKLREHETHIVVGHTHPTKLSGMNAGLLCSWSSVVTHDVISRHACHRMTLNLPSHNSVTEVAILTPI